MFNFSVENELILSNQLGFKPGGSYTNQLLGIIHKILKSFEEGFEVFWDILKVFDKVWHEGFIFKLKWNGIFGNLLNFLCDLYLTIYQKDCLQVLKLY